MKLQKSQEWENHVLLFLTIRDKLAAQDKNMTNAAKVTKILCTIPLFFDALAMASTLNKNSFHQRSMLFKQKSSDLLKLGHGIKTMQIVCHLYLLPDSVLQSFNLDEEASSREEGG